MGILRVTRDLIFTVAVCGLFAVFVFHYLASPSNPGEDTKSHNDCNCKDENEQRTSLEASDEDDYYGILGLGDDASMEEISRSFRQLSGIHHPDHNPDDTAGAKRRFSKVKRAYEILSDSASRKRYDYMKLKKSESPQDPGCLEEQGSSYRVPPFEFAEDAPQSHGSIGSDNGFDRENKDGQRASLEAFGEDDYYGILGLRDDASVEEIRLSFLRLSRIHHPDKNLDDPEGATRRFAKVNRAYETLSEPASREEYDYMKQLEKSEPPTRATRRPQDPDNAPWSHNHDDGCPSCVFSARWGLTSEHVEIFSLPGLYKGMGDSPPGFFALYRLAFDKIIADECKFANKNPASFPSFGYSDWPYQSPVVKKKNKKKGGRPPVKKDAKTFYDFWTSFVSRKDFGWARLVDLDGVPNSNMKRSFQRENTMLQAAARQQYTETVRNLVKYVRAIDPRCEGI